ncbi:hypothetical protein BFU36_04270 [Sulfolobus sp. A20]|uniref:hypothetical protein n=1 Tax=Saccharolobus sp. A20 TaxID=1891280 RepID=UPI000845CB79|nr:hypothetical protein [Sulfolobus sp. A20]TRM76637.1 hypothetical protein DJ532_07040 [Sulfolobus sp. A20-N-F8]TRM79287.1 hypothetical protein DJ528_01760 [Sulfolobus sp. B5]TRM82145.1 hypothetical protein DJ524_01540 [Sulfolobus sp. D5]TRM87343.1 hypothetical protein DJ529_08780 [Sulfolobus sp. C3]TRM91185.1 hypothetical protein DJ526_06985 [Sulfolobus sp. A20-N-G8]TRM98347.1 hypothetical protein DJ530_11065 [Sulfolobus sp. E1]TRM99891.1 hypothetical protein DJ527_07920 [Sulfolobus sp. F1
MLEIKEDLRSKLDYRIIEIAQSSPNTEIKAIIVTSVPPSSEIVSNIQQSSLKIERVFNIMNVVKVRGKVKTILPIVEKPFVKYIMLEEVIVSTPELL